MPSLSTQSPTHNLTAQWQWAGPDLLLLVTGGEAPHIGAVACATPRPSLADPGRPSATASVFCYVGHKEDDLAKALAEALCAALGARVVVAAGAHWEGLDAQGIAQVGANARDLQASLLKALASGPEPAPSDPAA